LAIASEHGCDISQLDQELDSLLKAWTGAEI
jgi:hypothetical protein